MGVSLRRFGGVMCAAACSAWLLVGVQQVHARAAVGPAAKRAATKQPAGAKPAALARLIAIKPARAAARPAATRQADADARRPAARSRIAKSVVRTLGALKAAAVGRRGSARAQALPAAAAAHAARHGVRALRVSLAPTPLPTPPSVGQAIGLKATDDPLDLGSSVALVVDQDSGQTLFDKNAQAVLPIASITKLMTSLVIVDAGLPGDETIEITDEDVDTEKYTRSRLAVGARLTRAELLQLALMASENRAAHALGRTYPGGTAAFVAAMNARARALGMVDTFYSDPTGLSSQNQSNARDLVKLLRAAYAHPLIRQFSTAAELTVDTGRRVATFRNTNRLTRDDTWDIGLQKTGFINEAGNCLVMQTRIDGRNLWMVLLDAQGRIERVSDANRLRRWLGSEANKADTLARLRTAA